MELELNMWRGTLYHFLELHLIEGWRQTKFVDEIGFVSDILIRLCFEIHFTTWIFNSHGVAEWFYKQRCG